MWVTHQEAAPSYPLQGTCPGRISLSPQNPLQAFASELGSFSKTPQSGSSDWEFLFPVLEVGHLRQKCLQGRVVLRPVSWACRSCLLPHVVVPLCRPVSSPPFIRTSVLWDQGPLQAPYFTFLTSLKTHLQTQSHSALSPQHCQLLPLKE